MVWNKRSEEKYTAYPIENERGKKLDDVDIYIKMKKLLRMCFDLN